ncbi:MAG: DUF4261 domain-containing protein [Bacteroidaceae bacterium]|nr:DUF4261 domain-containing protein [Bacteroidaceae bacterium]
MKTLRFAILLIISLLRITFTPAHADNITSRQKDMRPLDEVTKKKEVKTPEHGIFLAMILLEDSTFNYPALLHDLSENWGIVLPSEDTSSDGDTHVSDYKKMRILVSLIPTPIPNEEATEMAAGNYYWKAGAEVVKRHSAHLIVSVVGDKVSDRKKSEMLVKIVSSCCRQKNVLGVSTNGTVYQPKFYIAGAQPLHQGELPVPILVWIGFDSAEKGTNVFTKGMEPFGKYDMEVLGWTGSMKEILDKMYTIVSYILEGNVTLRSGETFGTTANEKFPITLSPSTWDSNKMTLKIKMY